MSEAYSREAKNIEGDSGTISLNNSDDSFLHCALEGQVCVFDPETVIAIVSDNKESNQDLENKETLLNQQAEGLKSLTDKITQNLKNDTSIKSVALKTDMSACRGNFGKTGITCEHTALSASQNKDTIQSTAQISLTGIDGKGVHISSAGYELLTSSIGTNLQDPEVTSGKNKETQTESKTFVDASTSPLSIVLQTEAVQCNLPENTPDDTSPDSSKPDRQFIHCTNNYFKKLDSLSASQEST